MNSTRSDGYAGDLGLGGRETWVQKVRIIGILNFDACSSLLTIFLIQLRGSYENAGKCVCLTWRGITACFLASRASFHDAVQCFSDAIMVRQTLPFP